MDALPGTLWEPAQGFPPSPSVVDPVIGKSLSSTAVTAVLTYTPPSDAGLVVKAVLTMSQSAQVTLYVTFTDLDGNAQTITLVPTNTIAAGTYPVVPAPIAAQAGGAVTVYARCATASIAKVTASIEDLV